MSKPYRPPNGTAGEIFMEEFCDRCRLKGTDEEAQQGGGCDIILLSMIHEVDHPDYPEEWQYDWKGEPTCTAFME